MKLPRSERVQRVARVLEAVVLGVVGGAILAVYLGGYVGKKVVEELSKKEAK